MAIRVRKASCCLLILLFCCILGYSAAGHEKKHQLPSAMVVGTVYCDTCFHQEFSKSSHFISGASVAVECGDRFQEEVKTNQNGVFRVHLPPEVSRQLENIKSCSVKLIRSSEPSCAVASSATSTQLHLKARRNGVHFFSAGFFAFKPLKQPELCSQQPKPFADQKQDQPAFLFFPPPIPFLPSPPNIGGVPLPPNPLQPPPSILPPLQPPPSIFPPIRPSPSILPPIPFLTPPPPPPVFSFPHFPFPPLFPGIPPAFPSKDTSP